MEPQITVGGNLVADPTRKVTASGVIVTKIRVASSGRRFDRARAEWVSTEPVYLSVNCWRQLGDNVAKSLKKGDSVLVVGRLTMREYDDLHGGPRRQAYEIEATSIAPDLSRYVAMLARPPRDLEDVTTEGGPAAATEDATTAEVASAPVPAAWAQPVTTEEVSAVTPAA